MMKIRTGIIHPIELAGRLFMTGVGGGLPIAGFLRLLFLWLSFISLTSELSSTTYKSPNSVATLLRSHGIFKGRSGKRTKPRVSISETKKLLFHAVA
jgi:hypothetical protein